MKLTPGLVVHEADGRYSAMADAVLRHGAALPLQPPHQERAAHA
jgi:hypothetical protein